MSKPNTVLITGGASGIGWSCAQEFLRAGWRVMIGDSDAAAANKRASQRPAGLFAIEMDVRSQQSVEVAIDAAISEFGKLGALVNNAGIQKWTALAELDWDTWNSVLDVNLNGTLRCMHAAGRHMLQTGGGSIVNIASIGAERGIKYRAPYNASKAAVIALTKTAAMEWASGNIRVNAVGPGYVATELTERFINAGQFDAKAICDRIPMNRMAAPEEIARAVVFLASDQSSYITGQTLFVDGGFLANSGLPGKGPDSTQPTRIQGS